MRFYDYSQKIKKPKTERWRYCETIDDGGNIKYEAVPISYCRTKCPYDAYGKGYPDESRCFEFEVTIIKHGKYRRQERWQRRLSLQRLRDKLRRRKEAMWDFYCKGCIHWDYCSTNNFEWFNRSISSFGDRCLHKEVNEVKIKTKFNKLNK
jgi:hypothetical protein